MNQQQIDQEIALLEGKLRRLRATPPDAPDRCYACGKTEMESYLADVTVITCEGEEGYSKVTMWLCENHIERMVAELQGLGFEHHHHGSTDLLENTQCRAYDGPGECPTPDHDAKVTLKWPGE